MSHVLHGLFDALMCAASLAGAIVPSRRRSRGRTACTGSRTPRCSGPADVQVLTISATAISCGACRKSAFVSCRMSWRSGLMAQAPAPAGCSSHPLIAAVGGHRSRSYRAAGGSALLRRRSRPATRGRRLMHVATGNSSRGRRSHRSRSDTAPAGAETLSARTASNAASAAACRCASRDESSAAHRIEKSCGVAGVGTVHVHLRIAPAPSGSASRGRRTICRPRAGRSRAGAASVERHVRIEHGSASSPATKPTAAVPSGSP